MSMTPLDETMHRLYERGFLERGSECEDISTYTYSYVGRLVKQSVTVVPKMKRETLKRIVVKAINGSLSDMVTLSMLYNVGYGVPKDREASERWARYATLDMVEVSRDSISFEDACEIVKQHVRECPNEFWPVDLTLPLARIEQKLSSFKPFIGNVEGATILPRFVGVRVYLFYISVKGSGATPHLYAGMYRDGDNKFVPLDKLIALGAPRYLGEHGGKQTMVDYRPFNNKQHDMYVVVGTLAVQKSDFAIVRQQWKNSMALLNSVIETPLRSIDEFALPESKRVELANIRAEGKKITEKIKTVKGADKANLVMEREHLLGRYRGLKSFIEKYDQKAEFANYLRTTPAGFLKLITHELYVWENGELLASPLTPGETPLHLNSLGFVSLRHPTLQMIGFSTSRTISEERLKEIAGKYEEATGFKVNGLIIQPKYRAAQLRAIHLFTQ